MYVILLHFLDGQHKNITTAKTSGYFSLRCVLIAVSVILDVPRLSANVLWCRAGELQIPCTARWGKVSLRDKPLILGLQKKKINFEFLLVRYILDSFKHETLTSLLHKLHDHRNTLCTQVIYIFVRFKYQLSFLFQGSSFSTTSAATPTILASRPRQTLYYQCN